MGKNKFDWTSSLNLEKEYWAWNKHRICSQQWLNHVKGRTKWFTDWHSNYGCIKDDSRILQIGSGAEGEINFIKVGHRTALDPLADFYKNHFADIIDTQVEFIKGRGEELPFPDCSFDLVIIFNALDHTESPARVMSGVSRVIKKAVFYI